MLLGRLPAPALALGLWVMSGPCLAMDLKLRTTTSATVSASSNPLLSTAAQAQAMLLELSAEPRLTATNETSSLELAGRLGHRRYSRLYGSDNFGSARLAGTSKRSERLEINGGANLSYDVAAEVVDDISAAVDPRSIRISSAANIAARLRLSERSAFTPSFQASRTRYRRSDVLSGYDAFVLGVAYSRQLSTRTSVGVRLDSAVQRYEAGGRSAVIALLTAGQTSLDEFTTLNGAIGDERVTMSGLGPTSKSSQPLTGNVNLCRRRLRMSLCAVAAARSDATSIGSLQRRLSAGLTFNHRPTEHTNYSLSADYQRSTSLGEQALGTLNFFNGRASVERHLSKVLTLTGFSNYRMRSGAGSVSAVAVGAGLRLKTGQP
jgi:hypothetical protein